MSASLVTPRSDGGDHLADVTSFHVQRAENGDRNSLDWVVRRFSPVLLAQARFRLGPGLRTVVDPEDLVSEVWAVALARLPDLGSRSGRKTPVLLKFLTTTLLNRVNDLVKVEIKGPRGRLRRPPQPSDAGDPFASIAAESKGIISSVLARERDDAVMAAIDGLDPLDREVVFLRAIEQNSGATVARLMETTEKAVSMRYRRALERLKDLLPDSIFSELGED